MSLQPSTVEQLGAVITIRDIYDIVLETKLNVATLNERVSQLVKKAEDHDSILVEHENKINDLYKKWYLAGGLGGIAGSLITWLGQFLVQWSQQGG